jgi:hypothetical protein
MKFEVTFKWRAPTEGTCVVEANTAEEAVRLAWASGGPDNSYARYADTYDEAEARPIIKGPSR